MCSHQIHQRIPSSNKVALLPVTMTLVLNQIFFAGAVKEEMEHKRFKEEKRERIAQSLAEQPPRPVG